MLTQQRLKELLHYDPDTGVFTWKPGRRGVPSGAVAGSKHSDGYIKIRVDGGDYFAHRLAWLFTAGEWPANQIDHINGQKSDNRINNLREASHSQNEHNKGVRKDSLTGVKGVQWHPASKRFKAIIKLHGKAQILGYFSTIEGAADAYRKAELELRGEFARASA